MRYGFLIDQNRCIGCHACTVACKEEHNIAVGVNRTWVKYIEKGHYPDTRRHFAVLRCNHCDDAPCIEICPTVALFRRADGIVDFDSGRCIGCKSCMQACPYDALYIDPDRNTAAKCNFDAPRVEMGYKPACEVVCPTQAILSGDVDDPNSDISRRIAIDKTTVRKPDKGTNPKLFYVGVEGDLLEPTRIAPQESYLWAEKLPAEDLYALQNRDSNQLPGKTREVYDVSHPAPWGKKVASYLWTKSISAGVLLISALLLNIGFEQDAGVLYVISPMVALLFLAFTFLLLVIDLTKPGRVFYIMLRPNLNYLLVLGSYILIVYGVLATVWLVQGITKQAVMPLLFWPTALFAITSACYSAFLFAQARGRDFWQSPLLVWQLLVQAFIAGSAVLILVGSFLGVSLPMFYWLGNILIISLLAGLAMIFGELLMDHGSEDVARSAGLLTKGPLRRQFWIFVVGLGAIAPIALTLWPSGSILPNVIASLLVLFGLWMYENLWIKAGQAVPLS
jgi:Fe-S-cluster-containing dehydrogenase component/formate-dependent nitrite reductase membrane component NrfD